MPRDPFYRGESSATLVQRTRELAARLCSPDALALPHGELRALTATYRDHVRELRARRDYAALDEALRPAGVTS